MVTNKTFSFIELLINLLLYCVSHIIWYCIMFTFNTHLQKPHKIEHMPEEVENLFRSLISIDFRGKCNTNIILKTNFNVFFFCCCFKTLREWFVQ